MSTTRAERVETVADAFRDAGIEVGYANGDNFRQAAAARFLASADPSLARALADHLAETAPKAMLTALTEAGVLHKEDHCAAAYAAHAEGDYKVYACSDFGHPCPPPRYVTRWE